MVARMRRRRKKKRPLHKLQCQKTLMVTVSCHKDMTVEQLRAPPNAMQECAAQETTQA
jgi:hypothetical protein